MARLSLEELLENAGSFHQAAFLCGGSGGAGSVGPDDLVLPFVVNQALAVELYFKALILQETGKLAKGHNLVQLFGDLTPDDQAAIRAGVKARQRIASDFDEDLKNTSDAFTSWRYLHERSTAMLSLNFLTALGDVVRDHATRQS